MRWLAAFVLAATACYSPRNDPSCRISCAGPSDCPDGLSCVTGVCRAGNESCEVPGDGTSDVPVIPDMMINTRTCAGDANAPLGQICFDPPLPAAHTFTNETISTSGSDDRCLQMTFNSIDVCVIVTDQVSTKVRFVGTHPIVLWSAGTLTITASAEIDVSSFAGSVGASGNFNGCGDGDGIEDGSGTGSGGGGGTLVFAGGNGGTLFNGMVPGGSMPPVLTPPDLRGGCAGGSGGAPAALVQKNGGGVVYLVAANKIIVDGKINASGGGAAAGGFGNGGGGGGSGGEIVFDALSININASAIVLALGGGGGSGGRNGSTMLAGKAGNNPSFQPPFKAQTSLTSNGCPFAGGAGGDGATATPEGGADSTAAMCGAGGGGGGDGLIRSFGVNPAIAGIVRPANISP